MHAIYDRVFVAREHIVSPRLTPDAQAYGMAVAPPQVVMARPTGVGRAITTYRIPIEGRDEWLTAARAAEKSA